MAVVSGTDSAASAEKVPASCTLEGLADQVKALTAQIADAKNLSAETGAPDGPDWEGLSASVQAMQSHLAELSSGKNPSATTAWAATEYEAWAATPEKGTNALSFEAARTYLAEQTCQAELG